MITDNMRKLIDAQATMIVGLTNATYTMLANLWRPYRRFTDYNLGVAQAAKTASVVESAMRQAIMRQEANFRALSREMNLDYTPPLERVIAGGVDIDYPRIGTTPLDVYQRPLEDARYKMSQGGTEIEGLDAALARIEKLMSTDLQLTRREAGRSFMSSSSKITGYRRVPHPELSKSGTCGLCLVASTRVYHTKDLMPIHDLCHCDVMPIIGDNDPGLEINDEDLQSLYNDAGGNTAADLLKTKYKIFDHGELGPVLVPQHYRPGPKQRAKKEAVKEMSRGENIDHQLHVLRKSMSALQKRYDNGEDVAQALQWQKDRILTLEAQLKRL